MGEFNDIAVRANGTDVVASWFNTLRTAGIVHYAWYQTTSTQAIGPAATSIDYGTLVLDSHTAVTDPTTDWLFVAPVTGVYYIVAGAGLASTAMLAAEVCRLRVLLNGASVTSIIAQKTIETNNTRTIHLTGGDMFNLTAADTVAVQCSTTHGSAIALIGDSDFCWVKIFRVA